MANTLESSCGTLSIIAWAERCLAFAAVLWLQVVGVVTDTILHHVLHALPLLLLALLPRSGWVRHTAALAAFAWIVMLALITPMIRQALLEGIDFVNPNRAYTWLAPLMALICCVWASLNLALLARKPRRWIGSTISMIVLTVLFAFGQPWISPLITEPLQHVLEGDLRRLVILLLAMPAVLALPWWVTVRQAAEPRPALAFSAAAWQAAYWLFFLACMVLGLSLSPN